MTHRTLSSWASHATLLACAGLLCAACDAGNARATNPIGPSADYGTVSAGADPSPTPGSTPAPTPPSPGPGPTPTPPSPNPTPQVTERLMEMLTLSIRDEYRALFTYRRVIDDFGDRTPFSNIVNAEAQHVGAVSALFANRGLAVPDSPYTVDTVPTFPSFAAACTAGVAGETSNWLMYSAFLAELGLAGTLPQDVQHVFTNLLEASRDKHLPAFTNCAS